MLNAESQFIWPPLGQERAVSFLEKSLISGKLAQTYIFAGPQYLGKSSLAAAFAHNLWRRDGLTLTEGDNFDNLNSDLYILKREEDKKQISVGQAREFIKRLTLSSFLNSYKIGIIKEAELLSIEAQNALLKTLEEPKEQVIIILLTSDLSALMSTITSRSQVLYFQPISFADVYDYLLASLDIKRSLAKELAAASLGRPLQARQWAENLDLYQEQVQLRQKLFSFLQLDLAERLALINALGKDNSVLVETALSWLDIWESLWRDALLLSLGQEEYAQYPDFLSEWRLYFQDKAELDITKKASACLHKLKKARTYIQGFVNPKNVLENLAIYF